MRQTNLSLDGLSAELEDRTSSYRRCLIINEIGVVCRSNNEEAGGAEEILKDLLGSEDSFDKVIALSWLSVLKNISRQTLSRIRDFRDDKDNEEIIGHADKCIENYRRCFG